MIKRVTDEQIAPMSIEEEKLLRKQIAFSAKLYFITVLILLIGAMLYIFDSTYITRVGFSLLIVAFLFYIASRVNKNKSLIKRDLRERKKKIYKGIIEEKSISEIKNKTFYLIRINNTVFKISKSHWEAFELNDQLEIHYSQYGKVIFKLIRL